MLECFNYVLSVKSFTYVGEVHYSHVLASRRLAIAIIPALFADFHDILKYANH